MAQPVSHSVQQADLVGVVRALGLENSRLRRHVHELHKQAMRAERTVVTQRDQLAVLRLRNAQHTYKIARLEHQVTGLYLACCDSDRPLASTEFSL